MSRTSWTIAKQKETRQPKLPTASKCHGNVGKLQEPNMALGKFGAEGTPNRRTLTPSHRQWGHDLHGRCCISDHRSSPVCATSAKHLGHTTVTNEVGTQTCTNSLQSDPMDFRSWTPLQGLLYHSFQPWWSLAVCRMRNHQS